MSFICHIHNYTEYNQQWNVFSAFNPSKCTHLEQWSANTAAPGEQSGVRCLAQGFHLSRGQFLPEPRFEPTTSSPTLYPLEPQLPHYAIHCNCTTENNNQGIIQNSPLCSTEKHLKVLEWRGWINDTIFVFGTAILLRATDCKRQARWWKEGVDQTGTQTGSVSIQQTRLFPPKDVRASISQLVSSRQNALIRKKPCLPFSFNLYSTCTRSNTENYIISPRFCNT